METPDTKEVAVVRGQATKALTAANELVITSAEELSAATDLLSKIKTVAKMIKTRKEAITKPLMEALTSTRGLFQPMEANLAEAERVAKGKMLAWQNQEDLRISKEKNKVIDKVEAGKMSVEKGVEKIDAIGEVQKTAQGKVGAITTKIIKKYRVTDETLLPRAYLTPDMGKITEALKDGKEVPGAEVYEEKIISAR